MSGTGQTSSPDGAQATSGTGAGGMTARRRLPRISLRSMRAAIAVCVLVLCVITIALAAFVYRLGRPPLGERMQFSTLVVDREGRLLRAFATADGRWRLPVRVEGVDPRYFEVLLGYEDGRFRSHYGVDPLATLRALGQLVGNRRIVSGGSTITMQVARLLEPRSERSLHAKLRQMVRAVEIERQLSKDEVLNLYLNLAPFGGNIEGIRAASLVYFGHES